MHGCIPCGILSGILCGKLCGIPCGTLGPLGLSTEIYFQRKKMRRKKSNLFLENILKMKLV